MQTALYILRIFSGGCLQVTGECVFCQIGKVALELVATSVENRELSLELLQMAESTLASSSSWRVRQACVNFVREATHAMILDEFKEKAADCLDKAMGDSNLEVRTTACFSLAGLLRSLPSDKITEFLARAPKPRRRGAKAKEQSEEDRTAQLVRRHAKVSRAHPPRCLEWCHVISDMRFRPLCERLYSLATVMHCFCSSCAQMHMSDIWAASGRCWR